MNLHEQEEIEFGSSGALWDAGEGVCCAAFQLGACKHTEAPSEYDEYDYEPSDPTGIDCAERWDGINA